jgi:DNA ligase-1
VLQVVAWPEGKPAPYLVIARAFAAMESTTKRLKKDDILVDMFRSILERSPGQQHKP